jgi:hypothetical protein
MLHLTAIVPVLLLPDAAHKRVSAADEVALESGAVAPATERVPVESTFRTAVEPFLRQYCRDCHGGDEPEAAVRLDQYRSALAAGRQPFVWKRVLAVLAEGKMPPEDHEPRPSGKEIGTVLDWIDRMFIHVDCSGARDPGRVTVRRLNRAEYNNTIRDLVGIDIQPADDFPTDDVGYGFDNIGDVLTLSPLLMEKYLDAAESIASQALSSGRLVEPHVVRKEGPELQAEGSAQLNEYGFHMISSQGAVFGEFEFPFDGDYILRTRVTADQAGPEPVKMAFHLGGERVAEFEVRRHREAWFFDTRLKVGEGKHRFAVEFLNDYYDPDAPDPEQRDRNLGVHLLEVEGPFGADPAAARERLPETYRRIVFVTPGENMSASQCARAILERFAARAYRRPVTDEELTPLVRLVEQAIEQEESFEAAIQAGIEAVLVSPNFLFRIERDRDPDDPLAVHPIADYELASRLSYFLWSTMPDEELFELAARGSLHERQILQQQVCRMLRDPRSRALVDNFASQWLNLRNLEIATPNQTLFKMFDDDLRADMRRETEMLFETVMREDLSIGAFLSADFTFVNERLATHYGLGDVTGDEFRKVSLVGLPRAGVLTHASILTLTSDPTKTSPVKRGKWILENLLGSAPPPPPAQVPPLEETQKARPEASLREQLELHRADPMCASCHQEMDPLGLVLENFDAVGRWRERDGAKPVDTAAALPTGETLHNVGELINVLRGREELFYRHFVRTMLTYALGRGLEYYDECAVESITRAAREAGGRFSPIVVEIVCSDPFLMRRGDGEEEP